MKRCIIILAFLGALLWAQQPDPKAIVGKIDDKTYTFAQYDTILKNYLNHHNPQNKKLSEEEIAKLNDKCWEELIGRYVYDKAIKAGKIKLTDAMVLAEAKKNPPAEVKSIKELQTKGKFDNQLYLKALNEVPDFKRQVIDAVRSFYQYQFLLDTIKSEVNVTADSVKAQWMKDNDSVDARIIFFDYTRLLDVNASDYEAQLYYQEHKEEYRKENGRNYRYVTFSSAPSAADSLAAHEFALQIWEQLLAGADFAEMAENHSLDTGSAANGGELGWFGKGRMVAPFEEAAFATPVGEISQPVLSRFGWHIIQVTGRRGEADNPEVEASHILLPNTASEQTLQAMKINSHSLHTRASQIGLIAAAWEAGKEVRETPAFFDKDVFIPDVGRDASLVSFAFENPLDSLADLYYASSGDTYVLETAQEFPVWYPDFEKEKANFTNQATTTKRMYTMSQIAEGYLSKYSPEEYLAQADRDSLTIIEITEHKQGDRFNLIGDVEELDAALFATEEGDFTQLIKHNNRWFLAYITKRSRPDLTVWERDRSKIMDTARNEVRTKHLNDWYIQERKKVSIIDNRADFYDLTSLRKMIRL